MKKLIILFLILYPCFIFAQKAKIEFEKTSHNFGIILERGGKVSYDFVYTNKGKAPLILTNVRTGCGCTVPEWSRKPTAPGEQGKIRVYFNPIHRPGAFVKSIAVNSNASNNVATLTLRGKVKHQPAGPYEGYDIETGGIRLNKQIIELDDIPNNQIAKGTIKIINPSSTPANITITKIPKHISASVKPNPLTKNQKGEIEITYNTEQKQDWGFVADTINLLINNQLQGNIIINANIFEDFSAYNDNFEKAPIASLNEKECHLTNLYSNTKNNHCFFIQNNGKTDLIIRKIICSEEDMNVHLAKKIIKPGKRTKASVHFTSPNRGKFTKLIQITTNDPQNPIIIYKLSGKIK